MSVPAAAMSSDMRELFEALRRDADHLFGTRHVQVIPRHLQIRESSEVVRAEVRTHTRAIGIYAKVFRPRPGDIGIAAMHERFRTDCDITRRVCEAMRSHPDLRAVELIASYPHIPGMVTKEIKGTPLNAMITANAAWPVDAGRMADLELALSRLGRWLATFQTIAAQVPRAPLDLDDVRAYIDARLRKLTALARAGFSQQDRREILAYVDKRAAAVADHDLVALPVHGDIVPSNVIVSATAITVLDFGMNAMGARYLDVARMFTQLDFYGAKPQFRPGVIEKLQHAVLRGFDPTLGVNHPLFEICAIQHVVCHYLSHARHPGRFPESLYSAHLRRRHRGWLRRRARTRNVAVAV
jgi:aminoglycoside phosphotransferase (APT) family kinase protein